MFTVSDDQLYDLFYISITSAVCELNSDVSDRMRELVAAEDNGIAKQNLELSIKNCIECNSGEPSLLCPDTGAPTFYVRMGDNVRLANGLSALQDISRRAVQDATAAFKLRSNMVHPITRLNPGTNVGQGSPFITIEFEQGIDYLEVTGVPISGGSETSGSFFRMLSPIEGQNGIKSFVLKCFEESTYAGKTCPPNVVGIGIGGNADQCMRMAKEAAVLRPIGSRHPEPDISQMELEFIRIFSSSGVGPMGMGGRSSVLDVHIEYAATHIAGLPVAYNAQCWLSRRKTLRMHRDGSIVYGNFSAQARR